MDAILDDEIYHLNRIKSSNTSNFISTWIIPVTRFEGIELMYYNLDHVTGNLLDYTK